MLLMVLAAAAAPETAPSAGPGWYVVGIAVATALGGILSAIFTWRRGRRHDTLDLYSSFVDDMHAEFARMKTQYDDDATHWSNERRQMQVEIDTLRIEVRQLRGLVDPVAVPVSTEAKSQIQEVMRQMGLLPDETPSAPKDKK